jgi:hypothetical protein
MRAPALPLGLVSAPIWHDQAFQAAPEPARGIERHDWAPGSRDCERAQITQICTHAGGTVTRQSAAPITAGLRAHLRRGSSAQGEGSYDPGMAYDERLAGRARDYLREPAGVGMNHG